MFDWHLFKAVELKWGLTSLKECVKTVTHWGPNRTFLFFEFSRLQSISITRLKGIWAEQKVYWRTRKDQIQKCIFGCSWEDNVKWLPKDTLLYFLPRFSQNLLIMTMGVISICTLNIQRRKTLESTLCLQPESWSSLLLPWKQRSPTLIIYHEVHWEKINIFIILHKYHTPEPAQLSHV